VLKHAAGMFYKTAPLGRFAALANPSIKQGCCNSGVLKHIRLTRYTLLTQVLIKYTSKLYTKNTFKEMGDFNEY